MIDRLKTAIEGRYRNERELGGGGMATVDDECRADHAVAFAVRTPGWAG